MGRRGKQWKEKDLEHEPDSKEIAAQGGSSEAIFRPVRCISQSLSKCIRVVLLRSTKTRVTNEQEQALKASLCCEKGRESPAPRSLSANSKGITRLCRISAD